jgi:primosomal protein N' (replication factor Y)
VPAIAQVEPLTTTRALRGPFDYRLPEELRAGDGAVDVGSMLVVPFGRRKVLGVVVGLAERSEVADEKLLAPLRALELGVPAELVELAEWLAREYCSTTARALSLMLPPGASTRLGGRKRRTARPRHVPVGARAVTAPALTNEQRAALEPICAALDAGRGAAQLLHGVTGSGKTEVYLRAAERALEQGRGTIVLVPEIALTPQTVARFVDRFGETVAVLHSRLKGSERYAEWRRLRSGEARICVGPRSAVFAPLERVGLVVVDEEHDASYKNESDPRYDAREVAAERAARSGAVLLLGSATPRPETVERTTTLELRRRVDGRPLPAVDVLDMRGHPHGLHELTAQALAQARAERGKAIVLLNRRGWSNFLSCRSCGRVWSCPDCDVALVLHRAGGHLACHHCGYREPVPGSCGGCGSTAVARHGAGTERLQHELAQLLDDGSFPVFRLDADTLAAVGEGAVSEAGAEQAGDGPGALLRAFEQADCGALIGTQMVAKGHDFPGVTLGVVLDADATLRFPDFRADERTFALIAQLAGRVGRAGEGRVLVQTLAPDARAIAYAAHHDSAGFIAGELERRRALAYPPFSHLVRIVCAAVEAPSARVAASELHGALAPALAAQGARLLGPAPLFRLRGRERQTLVVKAPERQAVARAVDDAVQRLGFGRRHRGVTVSVDVDPQ